MQFYTDQILGVV